MNPYLKVKLLHKDATVPTKVNQTDAGWDLYAYEDGIIYLKDILDIDEEQFNNKINLAATQAFNLAFNITYVTKDNILFLIGKAFNDTKALSISQEILDDGIIEDLLGKAEMSMLSLKNSAKLETKAQEVIKEKPKEYKIIRRPKCQNS